MKTPLFRKKKKRRKGLPSNDFPLVLETKISAMILIVLVRPNMAAPAGNSGKH